MLMLCSSALVLVMHATCLFDCDKHMRLSAPFPFGKHSCAGSMFRNKMHPSWDAKASSAFVWNEKNRILPSTAKIWSWLGKTTPVCIRRRSQDPPRTGSEQPSTWAPPPATVVPNSASESMGSEPCDRTPADALHLQRSTQRPGFLVGGPCQR